MRVGTQLRNRTTQDMRILACSQTDMPYQDDVEHPLLDKSLYYVVLASKAARITTALIFQKSL